MKMETYVFENAEGHEDSWSTTNYTKAREYAQRHKLKSIARIFEFADSEVVDDFTEEVTEGGDV